MVAYYRRVKDILSGQSEELFTGETADEVVEKAVDHFNTLGVDGGGLRASIRACVKQRKTP